MAPSDAVLSKKTKIICTIGPASCSLEKIIEMIEAGMNVVRLNCSHGDHATLAQWVKNVRDAESRTGVPIPIMLDLQGPKIRIGQMVDSKPVTLDSGQEFIITTEECLGTKEKVSTIYTDLPQAVSVGDTIFINDGLVRLTVTKVSDKVIHTLVDAGGPIADHKGINVPGGHFKRTGLTQKDIADIEFGKKHNVEMIAVSFVEHGSDLVEVKKHLKEKVDTTLIIAKIERLGAVENIDSILKETQGIMIARGDLGVEIQLERVPLTQKEIIEKSILKKRITIVATQMLDSMTYSPMPTRAEVSDVANSILDNTDAIMLSAETAMGVNPAAAVRMMTRIAQEIEKNIAKHWHARRHKHNPAENSTDAITRSAVEAAEDLGVEKIVVFTDSGRSALSLSLKRPRQIVYAFTPSLHALRQLNICHGLRPFLFPRVKSFEEMISRMEQIGLEKEFWKTGERIVVVSGPVGVSGGTNLLKLHTVGTSA